MAKRASGQQPREGEQRQGSMALVWGSIIFVGVIVISPATVILVAFGMLPTIVAFIVDRTPQKHGGTCVGGLNFCGLFSYLLDLWGGGADFDAAIRIITDPYAILVIFSSAAFGWMLFMTIPPVVSTFLTVISQRRVGLLRAAQKELLEEWGEAVANVDGLPPVQAAPAPNPPPSPEGDQ